MASTTGVKAKKKAKKVKLTPDQKRERKLKADHISAVRGVFRNCGFERASEIAEKEIKFLGQKGEFDDCFIHENLVVLVEYTISNSAGVSDHVKHKKIIFDRVIEHQHEFLAYARKSFPTFDQKLGSTYAEHRYIVSVVYCSRFDFDSAIKDVVTSPRYLDYPLLKYFEKVTATIKLSALNELLNFLNVVPASVGRSGIFTKATMTKYHGSVLPEEASGFPPGFKVISFYADADALLERAYVLRRKGWRSSQQAYQRLLIPKKVEAIRAKLKESGQVAINNIITTLPSSVLPIDRSGHTLDVAKLTETAPVEITLPVAANSVGLIDGQHRLFSYYRTRADNPTIAKLRHQQNLLVTGIIYPKEMAPGATERF